VSRLCPSESTQPTAPPNQVCTAALTPISASRASPKPFVDMCVGSPSPASGEIRCVQPEAPSRAISRTHWHPLLSHTGRTLRVWALKESLARSRLSAYQMGLANYLSSNRIRGYQIFVGKYGVEARNATLHILLGSDEALDVNSLPRPPDKVPIILLLREVDPQGGFWRGQARRSIVKEKLKLHFISHIRSHQYGCSRGLDK